MEIILKKVILTAFSKWFLWGNDFMAKIVLFEIKLRTKAKQVAKIAT